MHKKAIMSPKEKEINYPLSTTSVLTFSSLNFEGGHEAIKMTLIFDPNDLCH